MKAEKYQVRLLLDNAASHNLSDEVFKELTNMRVEYLPANTSIMQPLNAGIIKKKIIRGKRQLFA